MNPIKLAVLGSTGRVGSLIKDLVSTEFSDRFQIACELNSKTPLENSSGQLSSCDLLIDFSSTSSLEQILKHLLNWKLPLPVVTGSTGWSDTEKLTLQKYAQFAPVLSESNMSLGANLLFLLSEKAAEMLSGTPEFDVEILEAHHRQKKDAPSGTALRLGEAIFHGLKSRYTAKDSLQSVASFAREGHEKRTQKEIGFQVIRGGDLVGEHTAFFIGNGERLELSHRATDRKIFARGALRAATWLYGKPNGLYSMKSVLQQLL